MSLVHLFYEKVADLVIAKPAGVLLVMALLFLASFTVIGNLSMDSGSDIILAADDPSMIWYNTYTDDYSLEKVVLLYINAPQPLDYTLLHDLLVMEREISRIPGVIGTQTAADAILAAHGGTLPKTNAEITAVFQRLPKSDQESLVPDSLHMLGMITARGDPSALLSPIQTIIDNAVLPPGVTIEVSGTDAFNDQMLDNMTTEIVVLILGAFALMFIGLFVLFGSVRYRLLPLVFVLTALVYLFGILGALRIPMNIGAIGAFPVLLGLGIDYAVQFQSRLNDELLISPLPVAIRTTICNTGYAVLNAMIATALGFIVLFITPLPILTGFTQTAIIGIICAYGVTLFGFPALAILMDYKPKVRVSGGFNLFDTYNQFLSTMALHIARRPFVLLVLVMMLAGVGMVIDDQIPIDTSENSMVPPDMPAKVVMDKVTAMLGSQTPVELLITAPDVTSLDVIRWMDRYGNFIQDVYPDKILGVSGISSLIKQYNNGTIPYSQTELNQVMAVIPAHEKRQYLDGITSGLLELQTVDLTSQESSDMRKVILDTLGWVETPPGLTVRTTGDFEINAITLDYIVYYKPLMTGLAFLMIFLFLIVAYRHIVAVAPLFPIICVVGWNAVVMWIFSIDYTFITASLGAITIGVSSEYTILMMERYLEEKEISPDPQTAIQNGVQKIGASVTVSGLVTAFGFSALLLSSFPIISNFGIMTVIAVVFSLLGAIIIMPAVLSIMGRLEEWVLDRRS